MAAWVAATPPDFRFSVKAQRGGSFRALGVDPTTSVPWLTGPYRAFGERLGTVLFRVPDGVRRDDAKLAALLAAWPSDMPLTMEFQDPSWHVDETFAALAGRRGGAVRDRAARGRGAADHPADRARSSTCGCAATTTPTASSTAWAARLEPFLSAGDDVFVFFRHDESGRGPELAEGLRRGASTGSAADRRSAAGAISFGRPEDHEQLEPLGDVVEAVRDVRRDEDDRAGHDRARLAADRHHGPSREHVVELVLGVRRLRVGGARLEDVDPAGQVGTRRNS